MKSSKPRDKRPPTTAAVSAASEEPAFAEVVEMIQAARGRAVAAVNTALVDLYWRVGEYISRKLEPRHGVRVVARPLHPASSTEP